MPEQTSQITITSDLIKRNPAYREVVDQLEGRLYDRYMVYLSDKPRFNAKTQDIPKQYLFLILSFKNTLELNKAASNHKLSQDQRDKIPEILWKIFYKEVEIKNLPQMLNSELGLNNIHTAYLLAIDIANIYLPISDYLGDIPMVIKRWQYETPSGEFPISKSQFPINPPSAEISAQPTTQVAAQEIGSRINPPWRKESRIEPTVTEKLIQPTIQAAPLKESPTPNSYQLTANSSVTTPPPIRPPTALEPRTYNLEPDSKDMPIPKVQEIMSRISQKSLPSSPAQRLSELTSIPQKQTPWEEHHEKISQETKTPAPEQSGHSDLEPEYLPDEASMKMGLPDESASKPANPANVIDLKNF